MRAHSATPRFTLLQSDAEANLASFAAEVEAGLGTAQKSIPCRFLYDEEGSGLFEQICDLPEYYLTRAEREILDTNADDIARHFADPVTLAELGSGSSSKTRLLIEALLRRHGRLRYVPIDISRSILEESALVLLETYPALEIRAIAGELEEGLHHVRAETEHPKLIAWLGSSIGNLGRSEASGFLHRVRHAMAAPDRMLVGIDLRKSADVLEPAYDDAAGITARFSLNLLERMNRELGGHFETSAFRHRARWREDEGRVDISLVSLREQRVAIDELDLEVDFAEGEPIHVEDSYKYSFEEIAELTAKADLRVERRWMDADRRFSLNLLAA